MTCVRTSPPLPDGHLLRCPTDPSMISVPTSPPLPYGSLHAYPMDLTPGDLPIRPLQTPDAYPADPSRLPSGPLHANPTDLPTPPQRGPLDDPAGSQDDCRKGTPPGGAVATPWGPCVPHRATSWTLPYKEDPSGKTSQARSASQSPGPEGGPPQKKSAPPGPAPPPRRGQRIWGPGRCASRGPSQGPG